MTYDKALRLLRTARNPANGKPIANNTRLFDRGDHIAIRLHNTDIIKLYPNGVVVLRHGGWQTITTKDRLNRYTDACIENRRGTWYLRDGREFYNGMTLHGPRPVAPIHEADLLWREAA